MRKTKYNNQSINIRATIISLTVLILILLVVGIIFYKTLISSDKEAFDILTLLVTGFLFVFIISSLISILIGYSKAKITILKDRNNLLKNNPYIYYRELPNEYGIGIATILVDSSIEHEKDIVAVILDLCAKGYLYLTKQGNQYELKVLKTEDNKLLSNEKYILSLIIKNDINNINYTEWFNYCMQDGIRLGLFRKKEKLKNNVSNVENRNTKSKKIAKVYRRTALILSTLISMVLLLVNMQASVLFTFATWLLTFFVCNIVLFIILYIPLYCIPIMIMSIKGIGKEAKEQAFNLEILNNIEFTKHGEAEIQKLNAFKAFLKDFGMFASKKPEEIVLWEYYLSYAQVFGLTNEILATGYKKIIKNGSFEIDDIDLLGLNQINISI